MDIEYIAGQRTLGELSSLLDHLPHMGRDEFVAELERFTAEMYEKYNSETKKWECMGCDTEI